MLGASLGLGLTGVRGGWSPLSLGAALYDMWDAERTADLTLSGSAVTAWRSAKAGYSAEQAVGAARPLFSATSFGGRPGIAFDGADDELTFEGTGVFPSGAAPGEIWVLMDQAALASTGGTKVVFCYGGPMNATRRRVSRDVVSGANRALSGVGDGSGEQTRINTAIDLSGRHVVRAITGSTAFAIDVDGTPGSSLAVVPATGATRTRIGATNSAVAAGFSQSIVSLIALTSPLSADQAAQMLAYLKARGGIA